jgi:Arc/MetJ-type ribon-helix-helix transcriptional regulator
MEYVMTMNPTSLVRNGPAPGASPTGTITALHTSRYAPAYHCRMTTQIAIRLDDDEVAALDAEVTEGRAANRSDAVRRSIDRLKREQRYRKEEAVLLELARRGEAVYPDLEGITDITWPDRDWPTEVTRELRAD